MTTAPHAPGPHVLDDEWLIDYAAGTAPEPVSLLVASHLALSPAARKAYACVEAVGGAMLDAIEPAALSTQALDATLARLDAPTGRAVRPAPGAAAQDGDAVLPEPLRHRLRRGLSDLPWKPLAPGIGHAEIPCADARGYRLRLLRAKPGAALPMHTHSGAELALVIDGGYSDEFGHFVRGDVEASDGSVQHNPVADPDGDCIVLVVDQGPAKLTGWLGRLLNAFLR